MYHSAYSVCRLVNRCNNSYTLDMKTPAELVIETLGVRPLARQLHISPSTILRWREREGRIPSQYYKPILQLADGKLTSDDLVYGR